MDLSGKAKVSSILTIVLCLSGTALCGTLSAINPSQSTEDLSQDASDTSPVLGKVLTDGSTQEINNGKDKVSKETKIPLNPSTSANAAVGIQNESMTQADKGVKSGKLVADESVKKVSKDVPLETVTKEKSVKNIAANPSGATKDLPGSKLTKGAFGL